MRKLTWMVLVTCLVLATAPLFAQPAKDSRLDKESMKQQIERDVERAMDEVKRSVESIRVDKDRIREDAMRIAKEATVWAQDLSHGVAAQVASSGSWNWNGSERRAYERGLRALDDRKWEEAIEYFKKADPKERGDAALYWTAFAQMKQGQWQPALTSLQTLRGTYPQSRWLNDASALEVEIKAAQGKPLNPDAATDEDIRLIALGGIVKTEPDKALPYLEKMVLGSGSPKVKEEAMFLLARTGSPKAKETILRLARNGNPDIQVKAINSFRKMDPKESQPVLAQLYGEAGSKEVKQHVLGALYDAQAARELINIARKESDVELKKRAVRYLTNLRTKEANDFLLELVK